MPDPIITRTMVKKLNRLNNAIFFESSAAKRKVLYDNITSILSAPETIRSNYSSELLRRRVVVIGDQEQVDIIDAKLADPAILLSEGTTFFEGHKVACSNGIIEDLSAVTSLKAQAISDSENSYTQDDIDQYDDVASAVNDIKVQCP